MHMHTNESLKVRSILYYVAMATYYREKNSYIFNIPSICYIGSDFQIAIILNIVNKIEAK